jgi:hypothetical protein
MSPTKTDEGKTKPDPGGLTPGHPEASYVSPDLSFHEGTGDIPDEEKAWHEERNKAQQEGVKAAEESEAKAREEQRERDEEDAERRRKLALTGTAVVPTVDAQIESKSESKTSTSK